MPREGTRSQTGHSKPRVFPVVDTAPTIKRTAKPKTEKKTTTTTAKKATAAGGAKGAKPTGVTKKKAAPKKEGGVVAKKVRTQMHVHSLRS